MKHSEGYHRLKVTFTCSSHRVIGVLVSSSMMVNSRRLESRFDVRLTNGITSEQVSTMPITSSLKKQSENEAQEGSVYQ